MKTRLTAWLKIEEGEVVPLTWSCFYLFCLLCGYYILRPVRDEMAIEGGVQHLPWMMTATFLVLLAVTPVFGWLSARFSRRQFLPAVYLFFGANLLMFYVFMRSHVHPEWVARAFFVWLSVFNLFVVSVFWSFMVDLFSPEQGKRLFGMIAAGGSAGALLGPSVTALSTYFFPIANLMALSAVMLLVCVFCIRRLDAWSKERAPVRRETGDEPIGGHFLTGIRLAFSSPYLAGIAGYILFLTMTATFLYLEQAGVVGQAVPSPLERTRLYAGVDLAVSSLTFLTQIFVTARMPLSGALAVLPAASLAGFFLLGIYQAVPLFVALIIIRRVSEYALAKPAREVLFTVVSREGKYKAKNFIDTAISRGGDAATGWLVAGIKGLGATATMMAWIMVPLAVAWVGLGVFLARAHGRCVDERPHSRLSSSVTDLR
ncbi:MAG TPA: MFS transporter [Nitrospiraceae bacterium]|nr:MFS transporter [Nitrospiraceae bacterium]